jgi:hypothetical protein
MTENFVSLRIELGAADFDDSDIVGAAFARQLP